MPDTKNKITYAFVKKTRKFSIILILVMLFSSLFNAIIVADGDLKPDLDILSIDFDHTVYEGDIVEVKVLIKNVGTKNISAGTRIEAELRIDDILVLTNVSNDGLDIDKTCYINISWTAERGDETERDLEVEVNVEGMSELSYINNFISSSIFVFEGKVDLEFEDVGILIDGTPRMNEPIKIYANAKNSGRNTTENINVTLKIDGNYYDDHTINGLLRNEVYTVSFVWIPDDFGTAIINITIDPNDEIDEQDESNNYLEKENVQVELPRLEWWNTSWHYRKLFKMTEEGNVSITFNSTEILNELQISGNTFENDTVTVVKYFLNGTFDRKVSNYSFNESGKRLIWEVTEDSYYCVYFDVTENIRGNRSNVTEIPDMNESEIQPDFIGNAEGWWFKPIEGEEFRSYYIPSSRTDQLSISMESMAEVKNATATLSYLDEETDYTLNLTTDDNLTWFEQYMFNLSEIGNWSIKVKGYDDAGYLSEAFNFDFFVGSPDLVADSISIVSDLPEGSLYYVEIDYTIKANILVYNASVNNVNVTMLIDEIYFNSTIENISKNQNNMVNFLWHPIEKGIYNITIVVDPNNEIDESLSDENNNKIWQIIKIEGIPDLGIINISVPSEAVDEEYPAEIFVNIINTGEGNASNYQVNLYLEQHDENEMNYDESKAEITIDINISETKNISIIWDSADYGQPEYNGEWIVGVIIVWDDGHPDSNTSNNWGFNRTSRLKVNIGEFNKPEITIIEPTGEYERDTPVEIIARVTDESGIGNVTIEITNPENTTYNTTMTKQANNKYSYTFEDTQILGIYNFSITAVDKSKYKRERTVNGTFEIIEDKTPPDIDFVGVLPSVQLRNKEVTISCIALDPSGVESVQVTIIYPNDDEEVEEMTNSPDDDKYYYTQSYKVLGGYEFEITAKDTLGNEKTTIKTDFWITTNLEDTDSDGMPDWWEEKYGFDPFDPSDATEDEDDDGYTNLEEYNEDMDPLKPLSLLQRIVKESKENWIYVLVSGILFIVLIALSMYGIWRKKT